MKETLNTNEIADRLFQDKDAGWSYNGAKAIAEFLDTDENEDAEFDRVAIRCDFSEYGSAQEAAEAYGWVADSHIEDDGQECDADALQWLENRTTVLCFDGGVIIHDF